MTKKHSTNFKEEQLAKKKAEKQDKLDALIEQVTTQTVQETLFDSFQRTSLFLQDQLADKMKPEEIEEFINEYAQVFYYLKVYQYVIKEKETGKFIKSYAFKAAEKPEDMPTVDPESIELVDDIEEVKARHSFKTLTEFFTKDHKDKYEIVELPPILDDSLKGEATEKTDE